jgi:hypothetical protein
VCGFMSSNSTLQHRAECVETCAGLFGFVLKAQLPSAAQHVEALVAKIFLVILRCLKYI